MKNKEWGVQKVKFAVVEFTVVELVETSKPPYVVWLVFSTHLNGRMPRTYWTAPPITDFL